FYIILSGKVSVYVNTEAVQEDAEAQQTGESADTKTQAAVQKKATNRTKFGNHVGNLQGGASFGELALINKDCIRNASIIADCRTDLIVVNRATYNRSLREVHLAEFRRRNDFVDNCPVFNGWLRSMKRQAAMSLQKIQLPYNAVTIRQGDPVNGLMFLLNLEETEHMKERLIQKPFSRLGYNASERRNGLRHLELAIYSKGAVFGELEYGFGLPTYCHSAVCIHPSEFYVLDAKNFDRLINSRRNPNGWKMLQSKAEANLLTRFNRIQNRRIPLFQYLFEHYTEEQLKAQEEQRERARDARKETRKTNTYEDFIPKRGPLIDEYGPGTVFYRNRQRRMAEERKLKLKKRQMMLHPQKAHGWNKLRKEESPLLRDSNLSFYGPDRIRQTPPGTVRIPTRMSWMTGETGEMNSGRDPSSARRDRIGKSFYSKEKKQQTRSFLSTPYTAMEYQELRQMLREQELNLRHFRATINI
ncbi:hypothetical protein PHET_05122, partial [Paragonimus heterotremus]